MKHGAQQEYIDHRFNRSTAEWITGDDDDDDDQSSNRLAPILIYQIKTHMEPSADHSGQWMKPVRQRREKSGHWRLKKIADDQ